jgi:hypothetical protein
MTEMTGGRVFPVGNIGELPDIAAKIGMELRNQYVLGYKPSNAQTQRRWRKIKVKMRPPKGLPSPQRLRQDRILRAEPIAASLSCIFSDIRSCGRGGAPCYGAFAQQQTAAHFAVHAASGSERCSSRRCARIVQNKIASQPGGFARIGAQ